MVKKFKPVASISFIIGGGGFSMDKRDIRSLGISKRAPVMK